MQKKNKTPVQVIPGISIADMVGKTGLDSYKFGRIATIVFQEHDYHPESFFDIIEQNNQNGFHSLCLLDIRTEQKKFMKIPEAVEILEKIAKKKGSILFNDCLLAGLSGMASAKEKIVIGTAKDLKKTRFDETPQSLIVCGKLNDKEKESFRILWGTKI